MQYSQITQSNLTAHKSSFVVKFKVYYNKPNGYTAYYRYTYTASTSLHCKLSIATAPNTMYAYRSGTFDRH